MIQGFGLVNTIRGLCHESLFNELLFVEESFVASVLLEALRDAFVAIADKHDGKVFCR